MRSVPLIGTSHSHFPAETTSRLPRGGLWGDFSSLRGPRGCSQSGARVQSSVTVIVRHLLISLHFLSNSCWSSRLLSACGRTHSSAFFSPAIGKTTYAQPFRLFTRIIRVWPFRTSVKTCGRSFGGALMSSRANMLRQTGERELGAADPDIFVTGADSR